MVRVILVHEVFSVFAAVAMTCDGLVTDFVVASMLEIV